MASTPYLVPSADIDNLITALNGGVALTGTYTVIGGPVPTVSGDGSTRNTKIMIQMNPGALLTGMKKFFYDRLDLSQLTGSWFYPLSGFTPGQNVNAQLTLVRDMTGINFSATDLDDANMVDAGGGHVTATLTAKSTSLGFIGSVVLTGVSILPLSSWFTTTTLNGF